MRHGVIFSMQDPPGSPIGHRALYEAAIQQTIRAEQVGYDWINLTEHHVAADGYLPALLPMLAGMATVTKDIGLSTGMLILTLHQPLRIAEEAAVVDLLSGGRLTLGVAGGYREIEFRALASDYASRGRRLDESLDILLLAWSGEPFSYRGTVFQIPEVVVAPRPIQRPHPPLWIGGTSDPALRRAIRLGSPTFPGAVESVEGIRAHRLRRFELEEQMQASPAPGLIVPRLALVADTPARARELALPAIKSMFETYASWGASVEYGRSGAVDGQATLDRFAIVGDEQHCAELLELYVEMGVSDLMLQFALPTLEPAVANESMERFAALL
jgi:alkanesulfonate monooxygenase SsuD/methylene tetrahydromethanopterin reductase-like flavin-dependent oxidoreductase (luciferase family)